MFPYFTPLIEIIKPPELNAYKVQGNFAHVFLQIRFKRM